jgi:hypothetical protein
MINYTNQYDITNGIFLCFDKELKVRKLTANHSQQVRDKQKSSFPYQKFETWTKENFVIMVLYVMFNKKPPSFKSLLQMMREVDKKDITNFRAEIVNYSQIMSRDIEGLFSKFGGKISVEEAFNEYQQGRIKFYTLWFYLQKSGANLEEIETSRIKGALLRRIKSLMLYVTFKQESVDKINKLLKERLEV